MMKAFDAALDVARHKMIEQAQRLQFELSVAADNLLAAKSKFETEMQEAAALDEEARQQRADALAAYEAAMKAASETQISAATKRGEAVRSYESASSHLSTFLISLQQQIAAGEIVTDTANGRKRAELRVAGNG